MSIDCHIHLFEKNRSATPDARHVPAYDAEFSTVKKLAAPVGVSRFVLVQTSFMATDNRLLLSHIKAQPETFRGVFILDPSTGSSELRDLKAQGVVGIRLNLFGTDLDRSLTDQHLGLIERCSQEGMSVGLHDDASRLIGVLERISGRADKLVVDHFGRPESLAMAENDPAYDSLLETMMRNNSYVKISAPYRSPNMNPERAFEKLRSVLGETRLLWASDWPWTQNETALSYAWWADPFGKDQPQSQPAQQSLAHRLADNARRFYEFG